MNLSTQALRILEGMARDHGVPKLSFDETGLIPLTVGRHQLALGFSESNNTFVIMGVVDVDCDGKPLSPLALLEYNYKLSHRRVRIALENQSGALVMLGEIFLNGLEYWEFAKYLEAFVHDFEEVIHFYDSHKKNTSGGAQGDLFSDLASTEMMFIRS